MPAIKTLDRIKAKWNRVTSAASGEYEEGVRNPRTDWKTATMGAEKAYESGIQKSIQQKAFGKGVNKAGTAKWQTNAIEKGPARFSQGVQLAEQAYADGFAPFRDVIANLKLPDRGPKGDPVNIQRVALQAKALHDKKLSLRGGA
jgi:hypothetical protein